MLSRGRLSILLGRGVPTIESKHLSTLQTYPKLYEAVAKRPRAGGEEGFLYRLKSAPLVLSFAFKKGLEEPSSSSVGLLW